MESMFPANDTSGVTNAELPTESQAKSPPAEAQKQKTRAKYILLEDIVIEKDYQVRAKENEDVIVDYANTFTKYMKEGEGAEYPFPPVHVRLREDGKHDLIAGFQRVKGAKRAGMERIYARVFVGTEDEARELALKDNFKNGQHLSPDDKWVAITKARRWFPGISVRGLVDKTKFPKSTIQDLIAKKEGVSGSGQRKKKVVKKSVRKTAKASKKKAGKPSMDALETIIQGLTNEDMPSQFSMIDRFLETYGGSLPTRKDQRDFWKHLKSLSGEKINHCD